MAKETTPISITIDNAMLARIDRLAEKSDRSRSNMLIQLIRLALSKKEEG